MPLFGTDGVRGRAGEPPLDEDTVKRIGRSLAHHLTGDGGDGGDGGDRPRVLVGRDTRKSGPEIELWLSQGLEAGGASVQSAGVVPTPAVAFLTEKLGFDAGVVISASHNPFGDNGIKVLLRNGEKPDASFESAVERGVDRGGPVPGGAGEPKPVDPNLESLYLDHLETSLGDVGVGTSLSLVLDCAHGAGYRLGPRLLERLGVACRTIAAEPNGENINRECGSTHLDPLCSAVVSGGFSLGAALDGDGDRLLLCDSQGRVVDGDAILLMSARRLRKEERLRQDAVVATVMSNMALEIALAEDGIELLRTQVGDKFVRREMTDRNIILGGEQSGHILFTELANTGDGLLTLIQVLRTLSLERGTLDELGRLVPFPQILENVHVSSRPEIGSVPELAEALARAEAKLDGRGRVLLRYSGTEPLLRIMVEGPEREEIETLARDISRVVEQSIGGKA